jgi:hypothetical protein
MNAQTFVGSCHCGHVRFEAEIDVDEGTGKCNCTICTKLRFWGAVVKPSAFRLLAGRDALVDYRFNSESVHHPFCRYCGVHAFGHGNIEAIGGEYYSINLSCLDNASFTELVDAPVRYYDGRNNNWFNPPSTETRHL